MIGRDVWVSSGRAVKARARQQGEATTQRSPNQGQLTHHLTDALLGQPLWLCSGAPLGVPVGIALLLVSVVISLTTRRGAAARRIALGTVLRLERGRDFPEGHVAARVERGRVDGRHALCLSAVCPCGVLVVRARAVAARERVGARARAHLSIIERLSLSKQQARAIRLLNE